MTEPSEPPIPPAAPPAAQRALRAPSPRATAALAAAMLALGVGVGAAIGPAPSASLAVGSRLPLLLPSLLRAAVAGDGASTVTAPPAIVAQPTPRARRHRAHKAASTQPASGTSTSETPSPSSSSKPTGTGKAKKLTLPPVTSVWLIELTGSTLTGALEAPTTAPYINEQAAPAGTELSAWSAIDASAFASDAAALAGSAGQTLDTIVQPPCPEGAAGAACAAGTPGALSAADEFLKASVTAITATAGYRTGGLIVITFGSTVAGTASGLPSATSTTLVSQPPAGVLLISPFVTAGASTSSTFNPASPQQSLEKLLHP